MDIHHFNAKRSTTKTCWVFSQAGYDYLARKLAFKENLSKFQPGMPVPENYRQTCPMWWTHNGWVEEKEA